MYHKTLSFFQQLSRKHDILKHLAMAKVPCIKKINTLIVFTRQVCFKVFGICVLREITYLIIINTIFLN